MALLCNRKDTFVAFDEDEANSLVKEAKENEEYEVRKYSIQKKVDKKTGDETYTVVIEKLYE